MKRSEQVKEVMDQVDEQTLHATQIDPDNIDGEMQRVSADYSYWSTQYSKAVEAALLAEAERDRLWAGKFLLATEDLMPSGKPATVEWAKAMAENDEDYFQSRVDHIKAHAEQERLRGLIKAIDTKHEMLISIGANRRKEMDNDPLIRNHETMKRRGA